MDTAFTYKTTGVNGTVVEQSMYICMDVRDKNTRPDEDAWSFIQVGDNSDMSILDSTLSTTARAGYDTLSLSDVVENGSCQELGKPMRSNLQVLHYFMRYTVFHEVSYSGKLLIRSILIC